MSSTVDGRVRYYAKLAPGQAAVADGEFILTYGQLAELSGELAARLRRAGVAAGDLVILDCARGAASIVAMMAVLSIGAIFAPVDQGDPAARRELILRQSRPAAILASRDQSLASTSFELTTSSSDQSPQFSMASDPTDPGAYVMFTSGSTGRPKGALIGHRAILNLVDEPRFGLAPGVGVAHCANQAFDISTLEIWGALCNGGTVVPLRTSKLVDPSALKSLLATGQVDVMILTTAVFNYLADVDPSVFTPLRRLVFGGERASADHISAVLGATRRGGPVLLNSYGPTEATVSVAVAELTMGGYGDDVPIGTPLPNVGCHLLDERAHHAATGELYLSGACLAHGYWRDPEAT
ncbi:MAG: AMP-binding protein, partial [Trebonia sp.]